MPKRLGFGYILICRRPAAALMTVYNVLLIDAALTMLREG